MLPKITSSANPRIKQMVALKESKERLKSGLTLVDGVREIERALAAGFVCQEILVAREEIKIDQARVDHILKLSLRVTDVSGGVIRKVSYGDRTDGLVAVMAVATPRRPDVLNKDSVCVILDDVEKPGNIGAILRTADASGVDAVLIAEEKADLFHPNIIRASTGVVFSLPVLCQSKETIVEILKSSGIRLCVADPEATEVYTSCDLGRGIAFVLGREDTGVSDFWKQRADLKIRIPMRGQADSLNVSTAAAVIMYESLRQRNS